MIRSDDPARLLPGGNPRLREHAQRHGPRPPAPVDLPTLLHATGLRGRGGAGFPAGAKLAAMRGAAVVVANGAEGEPLSRKDAALLDRGVHLVLDGLAIVSDTVGARRTHVYAQERTRAGLERAIQERQRTGWDAHSIEFTPAPDGFVAGEKSAVLHRIAGGPAIPRDRATRERGVGGRPRPTLIYNVETLAQIALLARYGPAWFRALGTPDEPGTTLVTVSGDRLAPVVLEVPLGTPLASLFPNGIDIGAVLVGGFHGAWVPRDEIGATRLSRASLRRYDATPGAGVLHALSPTACPLRATAGIVDYLAGQSVRQCGPCRNGLPAINEALHRIANGPPDPRDAAELARLADLVDGRGVCKHPDGVARLVRSTVRVFADDVAAHGTGGCTA